MARFKTFLIGFGMFMSIAILKPEFCLAQHAAVYTRAGGWVDLGTLGGAYSSAIGINNNGEVVGSASTTGNFNHAFSWTAANGMKDLGVLSGYVSSIAYKVNDAGVVVGSSTDIAGDSTAIVWKPSGQIQPLPSLRGFGGEAWAVNKSGQVVGWTTNPRGDYRAFLWTSSGGITDLGTLGGTYAYAYDIDDAGDVTGVSTTSGDLTYDVFLWTAAGGMQDLGSMQFGCFGESVNSLHWVVGYCDVSGIIFSPVISRPGSALKNLPSYGFGGKAKAINSVNQITGYLTLQDQTTHAVIWKNNRIQDLGTLNGSGSSAANDINEKGQVAGYSD